MALDEIAFRPRVLARLATVTPRSNDWAANCACRVLAPVGALEIFDPAGAAASPRRGTFGAPTC